VGQNTTSTQTFGRSKSLVNCPGGSYGRSINTPVEEEHDEHGYVKATEGRVHHVSSLVSEFALPGAVRIFWSGRVCYIVFRLKLTGIN
jgi:hypothetical protein